MSHARTDGGNGSVVPTGVFSYSVLIEKSESNYVVNFEL